MRSKLYMVSPWTVPNGICLGQKKVDEKSNEIKAIPELIKQSDIESSKSSIGKATTSYYTFHNNRKTFIDSQQQKMTLIH